MNAFVKFSNFMSQHRAFDSHCHFLGRAFVQNDCPGGGFWSCVSGVCPRRRWQLLMTLIATLFTISYFSVVDPDEIILDEEDINDPFIHVNIKDIRTYSKEHPHICNSDLFTELILERTYFIK